MNLEALKELIDTDGGNAAKTDQEVLDWLNQTISVERHINFRDFYGWVAARDIITKCEAKKEDADLTTRGFAQATLLLLNTGQGTDLSNDDLNSLLTVLVNTSVITEADKDALYDAAVNDVLRWQSLDESLGVYQPNIDHVIAARGL